LLFFSTLGGNHLVSKMREKKECVFFGVGGERGIDSEDESKFWT
jgi:hypothetical protein